AALGTLNAAQAAPAPAATTDVLQVNSYAELLEPIPNAAATLRAVDEQPPAKEANAEGDMQVAQFYHHHHHHHHHHHGWRRGPVIVVPHRHWHHHHHHHHHHHGYYRY